VELKPLTCPEYPESRWSRQVFGPDQTSFGRDRNQGPRRPQKPDVSGLLW